MSATHRMNRDLVTNPAYDALLAQVEKACNSELARLTNDAQESDIHKVNRQAGILEGSKRIWLLLINYRSSVMEEFLAGDKEPGQ